MTTSEPARINTFCPVFPGFYRTMFEGSEYREAEEIASIFSNSGIDISERALLDIANDSRCVDWDYTSYHREYTERIVSAVSHELADLGVRLEFQALASPREYNFHNDVGDVAAVIDKPGDFKMDMMAFLLDHDDEFKSFIRRRFTSCAGFISFHSSDHEIWQNEFRGWQPETEGYDSTRFGTLLEFYLLEHSEFDAYALYNAVEAPDLLSYCSGPLLDAASKPREEWLAACKQMAMYAEEKADNPDAVRRQHAGHEAALVEMIRVWCEKQRRKKGR